ncbi:MAG: Mur ligase family protein, partial [Gammaproteobacteria bacterium]
MRHVTVSVEVIRRDVEDPAVPLYVLELSSFQLDLVQEFRADVAAILNIAPDHLDRHGDMAHYV